MSIRHALTILALLVPWGAHAQVRVFNPTTGQTTSISRTQPTAQPAGGVRFGASPAPTVLLPRATPAPTPTPSASPAAAQPPARLIPPASTRAAVPQFGPLGSAMVLMPLRPTTLMLANLNKMLQIPGLTVTPTFHNGTAEQIWNLPPTIFTIVPPSTEFDVDIDGTRAAALGIPNGQPSIAYRDPTGVVRVYKLVAEYAMFINHLDRVRSGIK